MAIMTASAGEPRVAQVSDPSLKAAIYKSIEQLYQWLEANDYQGYDTFDGLNARFVRPFTFETRFGRTVLQQGVRRFPLNLRRIVQIAARDAGAF